MKYIKLFEKATENYITATKKGEKVAKDIQKLVNKCIGVRKSIPNVQVIYNDSWSTFKYDFDPYLFIEINDWKGIELPGTPFSPSYNIESLINELVRLGCECEETSKHTTTLKNRNNRVFLLTQQQIKEFQIRFNSAGQLYFRELTEETIDEEKIYIYQKFTCKNLTYDKDIIIGQLKIDNHWIYITGFNKLGTRINKKGLQNNWAEDLKYVREATPEEYDFYMLALKEEKELQRSKNVGLWDAKIKE